MVIYYTSEAILVLIVPVFHAPTFKLHARRAPTCFVRTRAALQHSLVVNFGMVRAEPAYNLFAETPPLPAQPSAACPKVS